MFNLFKTKKNDKPLEVTDSSFSDLIFNSDIPVVLDFYASWCQPCQVMGSLITRLSKEESLKDKVRIAKVNIDANPNLAQHFKIQSIPTLLFIDGNKIIERHNGLLPYVHLYEKTEDLINGNTQES